MKYSISKAVFSALLIALAMTACGGDDEQPITMQGPRAGPPGTLNRAALRSHVQPMLGRLCAQTACHGAPERPLLLYSSYGLRQDLSPPTELTEAEYEANLTSLQAFLDVEDVTDSELLSRPLRPEAGGTSHGGSDQFYDRSDPSYVLFTCWLLGRPYDDVECETR